MKEISPKYIDDIDEILEDTWRKLFLFDCRHETISKFIEKTIVLVMLNRYHNLNFLIIDYQCLANYDLMNNLGFIILSPNLEKKYCETLNINFDIYDSIITNNKYLVHDIKNQKYYWIPI